MSVTTWELGTKNKVLPLPLTAPQEEKGFVKWSIKHGEVQQITNDDQVEVKLARGRIGTTDFQDTLFIVAVHAGVKLEVVLLPKKEGTLIVEDQHLIGVWMAKDRKLRKVKFKLEEDRPILVRSPKGFTEVWFPKGAMAEM